VRFATVEHQGAVECGVVDGDAWYPLPGNPAMLELLQAGPSAPREAGRQALRDGRAVPLDGLRLLPPVAPPSVRDFVAFEEHVEGVRKSIDGAAGVAEQWYAAPTFYFTSPHALVGARDEVAIPAGCTLLDYELEVAAVVGTDGADLTPEQGEAAIFGYTIFNDWSARDLQRAEMTVGLGPAKGKDFATTLGPWLVTADELAGRRDPDGFLRLVMTVEVNGIETGRDLLSNMSWTFGELVAYASRDSRVRAGDVLGSGTCGNGGCLAELWGRHGELVPPPLAAGDTVTMHVEGIGTISNKVTGPKLAQELARADHVEKALDSFMTRRFDRVKTVVDASVRLLEMHNAGESPMAMGMVRTQATEALLPPY